MRLTALLALLLIVAGCSGAASSTRSAGPSPLPAAARSEDWPMFGHDGARSGVGPSAPAFNGVTQAWAAAVDQQVYAQPLYVGGHVIVAT